MLVSYDEQIMRTAGVEVTGIGVKIGLRFINHLRLQVTP